MSKLTPEECGPAPGSKGTIRCIDCGWPILYGYYDASSTVVCRDEGECRERQRGAAQTARIDDAPTIRRERVARLIDSVDRLLRADARHTECVAEFEPDEAKCCGELLDDVWNALGNMRTARERLDADD